MRFIRAQDAGENPPIGQDCCVEPLPVAVPGDDFPPLPPVPQNDAHDCQSQSEQKCAADDPYCLAGIGGGNAIVEECRTGNKGDQGEKKSQVVSHSLPVYLQAGREGQFRCCMISELIKIGLSEFSDRRAGTQ